MWPGAANTSNGRSPTYLAHGRNSERFHHWSDDVADQVSYLGRGAGLLSAGAAFGGFGFSDADVDDAALEGAVFDFFDFFGFACFACFAFDGFGFDGAVFDDAVLIDLVGLSDRAFLSDRGFLSDRAFLSDCSSLRGARSAEWSGFDAAEPSEGVACFAGVCSGGFIGGLSVLDAVSIGGRFWGVRSLSGGL